MGACGTNAVNLVGEGNPERIESARVSGGLFDTLGVQPLLGRTIAPSDDVYGAPHIAVLSLQPVADHVRRR